MRHAVPHPHPNPPLEGEGRIHETGWHRSCCLRLSAVPILSFSAGSASLRFDCDFGFLGGLGVLAVQLILSAFVCVHRRQIFRRRPSPCAAPRSPPRCSPPPPTPSRCARRAAPAAARATARRGRT